MSRAGSAERSTIKVTGNRGVASRILRALAVSLSFRGRKPFAVAFFAVALAGMAVVAPSASAVKYFDSFFPNPAPAAGLGGAFSSPRDIAVRQSTEQIFVVDASNHRIQRFASDGTFERAWGVDVVNGVANPGASGDTGTGAAAGFEVCTTAAHCKPGLASPGNVGDGLRNGAMSTPQGIDLDQATGAVYVRDRANNRVNEYTPDGAFVRSWGFDVAQPAAAPATSAVLETCLATDICKAGVAGTGDGQIGSSSTSDTTGVAVAPAGSAVAGNVFVIDPANLRVQEFDVPTAPTGSVTFVDKFGGPGAGLFGLGVGSNFPRHVAVDAHGIVYAAEGTGPTAIGPLYRYDAVADDFRSPITGGATGVIGFSIVNGLEVDHATGHLFLGRNPTSSNPPGVGILELDLSSNPVEVDQSHVVGMSGLGLGLTANGLAINSTTGELLATTTSSIPNTGSGGRVLVFDDNGVDPAPTVELLPPTNVSCTTATLQANLNPNGPTGFPTNYRFQVSKTGVDGDWVDIAADQLVGTTGDGATSVAIDDQAAGLEANSLYRVRVVATRNPAAGTAVSAELVFVTDPCPPTVETIAAQRVSATGAQVTGRVNPNGLATDYWFEWGDNDYGNTAPIPAASAGSASVADVVGETLTGLDPERTYHFRLCASNSLVQTPVCGNDQTFVTRPKGEAATDGRAYEMVTSPDKALRRGGQTGGPVDDDFARLETGLPSPDGNSLMWSVFGGVSDPNAGNAFAAERAWEVRRRTAGGWVGEAVQKIPSLTGVVGGVNNFNATSPDFKTHIWRHEQRLWPENGQLSTRVMGDDGGPRGGGWYPILDPDWVDDAGFDQVVNFDGLIDDGGDVYSAWTWGSDAMLATLRNVTPADGGASADSLAPAQTSGNAPFLFRAPSWRPADLIGECTGTVGGGDETELPTRIDTDAAGAGGDDAIGARSCGEGSPTSVRGAVMTDGSNIERFAGFAPRMLSAGGRRAFFLSPDPGAAQAPNFSGATTGGNGRTACAGQYYLQSGFLQMPQPPAIGAATACPAQLFVRQYDSQGRAKVRWISRAEDELFDEPQKIAAFGNGAAFEGASRDGRVVYFRTNAPLTTDDPNGGASPIEGPASHVSWDLYRYELPADLDADPGDGELTRISGGPNGTADPNTNCVAATADCGGADPAVGAANGAGGVARYVSNSGEKVYFVTTSPIGAADAEWNESPAGSAADNVPAGTPAGNVSSRNLYLFDATKPVDERYAFIGRVPFAANPDNLLADLNKLDSCVSAATNPDGAPRQSSPAGLSATVLARGTSAAPNCVHGTDSGDAVVFETTAQLTADDVDSAADVYLYDATQDELARISAPPVGAAPYHCLRDGTLCNGDLGIRGQGPAGGEPLNGGSAIGTDGLSHYNLAQDGEGNLVSVFFETRQSLVPEDVNGDHMDVYEWRDGEISLISPGSSANSAFFSGSSRSGRDVFFWTEQRIDAREIDPADGDVYVARVGGGFPAPTVPPAVCGVLVDGCQGAGGSSVGVSIESGSGGNAAVRPRLALRAGRLSVAARRRAARTGVVALKVRTTAGARVRAVARGRVGRKVMVAARTRSRFAAAGVQTLRLRLTRPARNHLRRGRALRLTVTVSAAGAHKRAMKLTLRRSR
jgi:hypothetical protein